MTNSTVPWEQPSHPNLILVDSGTEEAYSARAVSLQSLPPNAVVAKITGTTPTSLRTYATVQTSKNSDIELNSDLVFSNHSCDPSVVFDMSKMEVRVAPNKSLKKGEDITFFYPSTEWDMVQPFDCNCGSEKCMGVIKGARHIDRKMLGQYWLNNHIVELLDERDKGQKA